MTFNLVVKSAMTCNEKAGRLEASLHLLVKGDHHLRGEDTVEQVADHGDLHRRFSVLENPIFFCQELTEHWEA